VGTDRRSQPVRLALLVAAILALARLSARRRSLNNAPHQPIGTVVKRGAEASSCLDVTDNDGDDAHNASETELRAAVVDDNDSNKLRKRALRLLLIVPLGLSALLAGLSSLLYSMYATGNEPQKFKWLWIDPELSSADLIAIEVGVLVFASTVNIAVSASGSFGTSPKEILGAIRWANATAQMANFAALFGMMVSILAWFGPAIRADSIGALVGAQVFAILTVLVAAATTTPRENRVTRFQRSERLRTEAAALESVADQMTGRGRLDQGSLPPARFGATVTAAKVLPGSLVAPVGCFGEFFTGGATAAQCLPMYVLSVVFVEVVFLFLTMSRVQLAGTNGTPDRVDRWTWLALDGLLAFTWLAWIAIVAALNTSAVMVATSICLMLVGALYVARVGPSRRWWLQNRNRVLSRIGNMRTLISEIENE
jgi:hypothetical protein